MAKEIKPIIPEDDKLYNILSKEEISEFKAMKSELQDSWIKNQVFRTETEMRISVLNDLKNPTPAAKYWQAVREQTGMFEQMVLLSFEYRKLNVEIKQTQNKIESEKDELEKELLQIDLDRKLFHKAEMELQAKDRMRELRLWSKLKKEQVEQDPNFNQQDVNAHQGISIPKRLSQMFGFFDKAKDADGAKNIAGQLMTAERLHKEGKLKVNHEVKEQIDNDKGNK